MSISENKPTVLIIDDDELIRLSVTNVLKKNGLTALQAENGHVGVEIFKRDNPAIVITDMLMPDKEGLETISEIRALSPKAKIIAISGGGNTQNMSFLQLAQKIGADKIISKPLKPSDLMAAIKDLLQA
ncbi:MAG: response regulator [Alphaproteobacteria bacterium]|nr:response regulator [Alphaproteobacteria bacterium]